MTTPQLDLVGPSPDWWPNAAELPDCCARSRRRMVALTARAVNRRRWQSRLLRLLDCSRLTAADHFRQAGRQLSKASINEQSHNRRVAIRVRTRLGRIDS